MEWNEIKKRMTTNKKPKEWWGDSNNAEVWLEIIKMHERIDGFKSDYVQQIEIICEEIKKREKDFQNIIEVGGGDGRNIGNISERFKNIECYSVDINQELSKFVNKKYSKVKTIIADIIKLPFEDNSFDLVFTFQTLQHIPPEEINLALKELMRISKKEIWLYERRDGAPFDQKSKALGGSFVYYFDQIIREYNSKNNSKFECYKTTTPINNYGSFEGIMLYKIKK